MFFDSPEVNLSILFSMYLLRMTKKMDYFLRNFVRRENVSLVQYQSTFFHSSERLLVNSQQVPFFVVLLLPLIGMQIPSHSVVTVVLQADLQELLCRCCSNRSQIYLIHEKILTHESVLSLLKDIVLISTPCLQYRQLVVTSSTSPIFVFPWIHPLWS